MKFEDAIQLICDTGKEIDAITILLQHLDYKKSELDSLYHNAKASIKAIQKINAANKQNDAIDSLCESVIGLDELSVKKY